MQSLEQISSNSFMLWCWQYRKCMLILIALVLLQFATFKFFFPYPNFLPDSFSYIEAALNAQHVNLWPIGYSRFLGFLSLITRSHLGLILLQYLLLQGAVLYFLFSVACYLSPRRWGFRIMLLICMFNPLLLHVSNFVSSDALFAALSLIWFSQLLHIINKPKIGLVLLHALVLLLVFTVRYNALYYPFISITAVALTKMFLWKKRIAVTVIILLLGVFIGYTQWYYDKETGRALFSPFGGWQLASNALFAYAHVVPDKRKEVPVEFYKLQTVVDLHMDSLRQLPGRPDATLGIYYLWDPQSPLQKFTRISWRNDTSTSYFARWALMGPVYSRYGRYLMKEYPGKYIQYYVWPNLIAYYVPQPEFLSAYNMGKDTVEQTAVTWFRLKSSKVHTNTSSFIISAAGYYPITSALVNLLFLLSGVGFVALNGLTSYPQSVRKVCCWFLLVWLCNIGFSVLASPIVLRYQIFPIMITQTMVIWLVDYLIRVSWSNSVATSDVVKNSDRFATEH